MSDAGLDEGVAAILSTGLATRWLGRVHRHCAQTGSTNDDAAAWASAGAPHGALVTADAQDAGRGRFGRVWHSPGGSHVYASVVLRPQLSPTQMAAHPAAGWAALGLAVGVGLRDGLAQWCTAIGLKWPNDLMIGERKLAGILCEARWIGSAPQIVVGFGINVRAGEWPAAIRARAVALDEVGGAGVGRAAVLVAVLGALEPVLDAFALEGFAAVRERYEAACVSLGRIVRISDGAGGDCEPREVFAVGLDHDGALLVRHQGAADLVRVDAGELVLGAAGEG